MKFPLGWLLFNKWLWITIFCISAVAIGPFIVLSIILALPQELRGIATLMVIFSWGIAAGYKDWIIAKRQEEKMKLNIRNYYEENSR